MADYYYFKRSGKWKYESEGASLDGVFAPITHDLLYQLNGGQMPGIMGDGKEFIVVVMDDDSYPRMALPETEPAEPA